MNKEITFDKLPEAVTHLTEQVSVIKEMLSALRPSVHEEKSLIGIDEACEVIQKAKPTIYALVRKGIIPAYKRGKKLYFHQAPLHLRCRYHSKEDTRGTIQRRTLQQWFHRSYPLRDAQHPTESPMEQN